MVTMFDRRALLLGAAATGVLAAPWVRTAHAQEKTITLMAYTGIFEERYKAAVVDPFMRANPGIKVNYYGSPNSAQSLGMLRAQKAAPQTNLCIMDASVAKAGTDEQLYDAVDNARLPVLAELNPMAIIPGLAGPAVTFDSAVLLYSAAKVKPAPTSWRELWKPGYKGQVGLPAAPDIVGLALTMVADRLAGGTDFIKDPSKGIALVGEMAPSVQTWDPKPDVYSAIISGGLTLGVGWNARGQLFSSQNPDRLGVTLPEEGSVFQINTLNLVKGAPNNDAALAFMAYALGQEAQKSFTEAMFYAPTNAKTQVSAEALARTAATPERMAKMIDVNWIEVAKVRDGITEQWRRRVINRR